MPFSYENLAVLKDKALIASEVDESVRPQRDRVSGLLARVEDLTEGAPARAASNFEAAQMSLVRALTEFEAGLKSLEEARTELLEGLRRLEN